MAVANNADDYAASRIGIFFAGVIASLNGQCVSLTKWFMQEMSDVPNPQAARGDARYVGDNLVAQGHAVEVPASQRKRGDIVVWKFGVYGHIAVLLSGDRVFEQNVNIAGVASMTVTDGKSSWKVYASRIGKLYESWRPVAPTFYRLKTYKEGNIDMITKEQYLVGAQAVGTVYGKDFNYDPNRTTDQFVQFLLGQSPRITRAMETEVADSITGVKGVIGWNGYNSPFVGKQVVFEYPRMVKHWIDYAKAMPKDGYEQINEPVFRKAKK